MRTIKFRGKRLDNGEWVYGYYWRDAHGSHKITVVNDESHCYMVDPSTVGQLTGLLDKNGKEIYEGDVLTKQYRSSVPTLTVAWHTERAMFIGYDTYNSPLHEVPAQYIEITGTIHDKQ